MKFNIEFITAILDPPILNLVIWFRNLSQRLKCPCIPIKYWYINFLKHSSTLCHIEFSHFDFKLVCNDPKNPCITNLALIYWIFENFHPPYCICHFKFCKFDFEPTTSKIFIYKTCMQMQISITFLEIFFFCVVFWR